jgi:GntR family transcriptional regulator, carbon starvation induced regulator
MLQPIREGAGRDLPLAEQAFRLLRGRILRCEIEPGAKLKVEALQREHGFSSSPLREALNRLAQEGLVRADERRGFRAAPVTVADLRDVTRMRLLIDGEALRDALKHGDDAWEAHALATFHRLEKVEARIAGPGPLSLNAEWSGLHRQFHVALLAACPSPKLLELSGSLFDQAERYRRLSMRWRKEPRNKAAEHRRILDAALARDAKSACALLHDHIARTAANVEASLLKVSTLGEGRA